jgi:glycosyltransferase involved in cell wall biosynthesis
MKIFVVVPVYNEEKHIKQVLDELSKSGLNVVVVDDGSQDKTKVFFDKGRRHFTYLCHKINLGKGAALKTGADYAFADGADAVIFFDSDGQHSISDLYKFISVLKLKKHDVIFGTRNFGYGVPLVRFLGNKFASVFMGFLFRIFVSDVICGFRAITKKAYAKIKWKSSGYGVETEMVARVGIRKLKFTEIPVETIYHDINKGVTLLDALSIFGEVIKWRFVLK